MEDEPEQGDRLGDLFRRVARAGGFGRDGEWQVYVAGRLGITPGDLARMLEEPVPADRVAAERLARDHGVDGYLFWLTVRDARDRSADTRGP